MTKIDEETKQHLEILKALNDAVNNGPWEHSAFFKAIGEKLTEIRDRFKEDLALGIVEETGLPASLANRIAQRQGLIEIFVVLYNADGSNMYKWEATINSIRSQSINRPIYRDENLAKAALRGAINKQNEAYIAAFINEENIMPLPKEKRPHDRWDNELIVLNEAAIQPQNITRFIHVSGTYEIQFGKLVRQGTADFL
jgi:intracellular multiplication protein IcmQ